MLQHNAIKHGQRAHAAHAAVVGLHALCCGLPALAMSAAALAGAASSLALASEFIVQFHEFMHRYELWVLAVSAALVVAGGGLELLARHGRARLGFPWLFAFSAACFALNFAIIAGHRL